MDEWLVEPDDRPPEDRETKAGPEDFVPDEGDAKPTAPPGETIGAETAQWIVPDLAPNGQTIEEITKPAERPKPADTGAGGGERPAPSPVGDTAEANLRGGELGEIIAQLEARLEKERERADREAERANQEAAKVAKLASQGKAAKTRTATRSKKLKKAEEQLKEKREENAALAKQLKEAEQDFDSRLAQMEADLTKQSDQRETELRERIKDLEAELAEARKQKPAATTTRRRTRTAKATTTSRARGKSSTRSKPAASRPARSSRAKRDTKNGKLDLNEAKFEELRELGLSVTQSARLIAYRDVRGGYGSLDELDEIPGLSAEIRRELRGRLQLN